MQYLLALALLISSPSAFSKKYFETKVHYRTSFGSCPSKAAGRLTLDLTKEFEKNKSLLDIKKKIVKEKLEEKFFLSHYRVKYDPLQEMLRFEYDCPKPLMKVQIYKNDGEEFYTAILVDSGELFDPAYEMLLRSEKKLKTKLPHMALPVKLIETDIHKQLTSLLNSVDKKFVKNISEVIINEKKELTIIMSVGRKPSSAFLGKEYWGEKVEKLDDILSVLEKKKTIPAVINLTNPKKIVVKFTDNK